MTDDGDRDDTTATFGGRPAHGQLSYLQIPARDISASATFYGAVFGWKVEPPSAGFEAPVMIGQFVEDRPPSADAGVLLWIMVESLEDSLTAAEAHGGATLEAPMPDGPRRLAVARDPAGNAVGLVQLGG